MTIYDSSENKIHKMSQETFDYVMDCIYKILMVNPGIPRTIVFAKINQVILEKTEIVG